MDFFNGNELSTKTLLKELKKILRKKTIVNSGGVLFKVHISEEKIAMGMVPYFWYGERKYHYDIHLPEENEFTLFGNITGEGVVSIFFKMENITEESKRVLREKYSRFSSLLLQAIDSSWTPELDTITLQLLKEKNIYPESALNINDLILPESRGI